MIAPENWQPADGLTLEPNALRAAKEQTRCLALTAGPGAGKTEMLAQRADFLLRTNTCRYPKRILAISFKVDASRNLKQRIKRRCGADLSARFDSYTFHAFAKRIIDRFRPILTGKDALVQDYTIGKKKVAHQQIEFEDLVPLAIKILHTSRIALNAVRQTYSDVFLDEFQDCTAQQYKLVKLAFMGTTIRLTAVGDTKQKIMGFAGALDGVFSTFATDFNAEPLNMYRNFRSKPRLLQMQNNIIAIFDPAAVMAEEIIRGNEGEIDAWRFATSQDEATHIAQQISIWIAEENIPLSEIAILVSKQLDLYADLIMIELQRKNIPYRNEYAEQDLSAEPLARLLVDYLLVLYGEREPVALMRLLEQLTPYVDYDEETALRRDWHRFIKSQREELYSLDLLDEGKDKWWDFVCAFLRKADIPTLVGLSAAYESRKYLKKTLQDVKKWIEDQLTIERNLVKALTRFSEDCAVRILTIHKSKGLEFDSVIILGVEEETFWGKPDEERCAFFVGISRAKRRLILTCCETRSAPPKTPYWWTHRNVHEEFFSYFQPFIKL